MENDDVSLLIDSLWFFSNVLSMSPPTIPTQKPANEEVLTSEPINVQNDKGEEKEIQETTTTTSCSSLAAITENDRNRRRIRRGKSRVFGKVDVCFYEEDCEYCERMWCLYDYYENMPPMSDVMDMKEHIRSWACAVACVVR